uniref:Sulfotransferase domain-containing protein n=1 Tax=Strongyloides stercoralis TaxID=6248 RepID=A0A0K0DSB4_STRER
MDNKHFNNLKNFEEIYGVKKFNRLIKRYNFVIFVRNPIERLISGFMHLCYYGIGKNKVRYCYGCNKNLTCFVNVLEKRLWQTLNHKVLPYKNKEELFYSHHFYPQTWSCDYYKLHQQSTYIKYNSSDKDSFFNNYAKFLQKSQVSNKTLNFIKEKIFDVKTDHVTISKNQTTIYKNMLYNDSLLLQKVCSIYYYDFIKFGFEFPEECKN